MMNFKDFFSRDADICNGQVVIKGTRVPLRTILASLADGDTPDQIIKSFPTLKQDDIKASIAYAAACAEEDQPIPAVPLF